MAMIGAWKGKIHKDRVIVEFDSETEAEAFIEACEGLQELMDRAVMISRH